MYQNWILYFILIVIFALLSYSNKGEKTLEMRVAMLVFLMFFLVYFIVLIVLNTYYNGGDLLSNTLSGSSSENCETCEN